MATVTTPPPSDARKGARTRAAILEAAARSFRHDGFDTTTLAGVAKQLGITRSAVLHHFTSKASLLEEVVRPFVAGLDRVLEEAADAGPFTIASRRRFVVALVDLCAEHRDAVVLVTRDLGVHAHLPAELQLTDRLARWVAMTHLANAEHPRAVARSLAALGAAVRPLAAPDEIVDTDDPAMRAMLVNAAIAVLKTPLGD
jgi:AcrR family transcriptional regulator